MEADDPGVAGIVLAAGLSTRSGVGQKLLTPLRGRPMVRHAVQTARSAGLDPVVVVTGHEAAAVEAALAGLPVVFARNPAPEAGITGSIRVGVTALPPGSRGAAVLLGDMPWVSPQSVRELVDAFDPDGDASIVVPRVEGRRGNPVVWAAEHFPALAALEGDVGARGLIERHADRVRWVDLSHDGVLRDVDEPSELAAVEAEAPRAPSELAIRAATVDDLPALVQLEESAFEADRISRRSMRHLLQRAHAAVRVAVDVDDAVVGSVVLLFSRGTATVRLYSIAVHPAARGRGVARRLVEAAEAEARRRERAWVRLEIRRDNTASIGLFESLGYRRFGSHDDYYADHMEALRYEKAVDPGLRPE